MKRKTFIRIVKRMLWYCIFVPICVLGCIILCLSAVLTTPVFVMEKIFKVIIIKNQLNMRLKLFTISILTVCLCSSCGRQEGKYEKAIADFVQTDKNGVWTDLQFKVLEMGEPTDITVGDSIKVLTEKFEVQKAKKMEFVKDGIDRNRARLEKEKLPVMRKFHKDYIDKNQPVLDYLSQMRISLPQSYIDSKPEQVLVRLVECKFSIVPPTYNTRQEITETFVFTADGTKCLRRASKK